jgi:UDPglucose--hexose-1-phosphate uridylyltransferase
MPEMRKNPLSGNWVILAPERAHRPESHISLGVGHHPHAEHHHECHFCYGNERTTPMEVLVYGRKDDLPNSPGWELRVVSNKFPAVDMTKHFCEICKNYMEIYAYAEGLSEVVIETPHHSKKMALYNLNEIELVLNSYKERYIAISQEKHIKYVSIFKNCGIKAGASISHSHSQIIGVPIVPPLIEQEISLAESHFKEKNTCIYCDMIHLELKEKSRIIFENDEFISFMPYAAKVPFEMWILPKFHSASFEKLTGSQTKNLAEVMKAVLYKLHEALENVPYNYYIHTSPAKDDTTDFYHWHIELIPRTTTPGGFELGTGIFINISTPEENAKILRKIEVK